MYAFSILVSLTAAASASKAFHYTVPTSFKAAAASNCTLPAEFTVTDFTYSTDNANDTLGTVNFKFSDPDTKIEATCQRTPDSTSSGPSSNIYACNNANIAFIYQTTGIAGLTLIEKACPGGSGIQYEASGLVTPDLVCEDAASGTGTICHSKESSIAGDFDSFGPVPPTRGRRLTRRG
ncbi:hypothetical protein NPX13_g6568 [Xylaria arbuscula]|uniref:AA1-like domain-containing protein n=1 Tax=Xylaria arbuscula TaxID=114810 RepID=A0A9W8NCL7_9PEZI|nr:hypothetical protein NPX13_g6568 [Xylaria arbuscula]